MNEPKFHETVFTIPNHSFESLFSRFTSEMMLDIFAGMLEERPIFLVMDEINESSLIIESFIQLI